MSTKFLSLPICFLTMVEQLKNDKDSMWSEDGRFDNVKYSANMAPNLKNSPLLLNYKKQEKIPKVDLF